MLIIGEKVEIWIEHCSSRVLNLCTMLVAVITVFITRNCTGSLSVRSACWSLMKVGVDAARCTSELWERKAVTAVNHERI